MIGNTRAQVVLCCLVMTGLAGAAQEGTANYLQRATGLTLTHPSAWSLERGRVQDSFRIPVSGDRTAQALVFSSAFRGTIEEWQNLQTEINKALRREVSRQWQETILGVPLLLSRLNYREDGQEKVTLVGLLYTRSEQKFHFRLISAAEDASDAERLWREVLLTMRTQSGQLPEREDPAQPVAAATAAAPERPRPVTVLRPPTGSARRAEVGPVEATVLHHGAQWGLRLARGWSAADLEAEGGAELREPNLRGTVVLVPFVDSPVQAFQARVRGSLIEFDRVQLRQDFGPRASRAGSRVKGVWRFGTKGDSTLAMLAASGEAESGNWLLVYRGTREDAQVDRPRIEALIEQLAVVRPS